ncbi:GNAT family N-acetyltransferase [Idiomarina seosinensis]|uniref:N-acetyltransferase n=1 Tax=Idiomarina seosinensis TaxID=281739 RepID=A0A432ZBH7_9GAMM|nr:GNAT family N-acetyltransferase [Idiomarina seosinensis]RUO75264.1 N-acetyltransferase [Idiomarina seosinensis]
MSSSLKVRLAERQDLEDLTELEQRTFDYSRISRRNFLRLIQSPSVHFWVVTESTKVIAYAIALTRKNSRYWRIYSIAVDAQHRGRGIARALLEHIITEAKKGHLSGLTLEVKSDNITAIKLYQLYHFETIDVLPNYYDDGTDGFKMRLTFYQGSH